MKQGRGKFPVYVLLVTLYLFFPGSMNILYSQPSPKYPVFYLTPKWNPDGTAIAFCSNRDDKPAIYTISPDGKNLKRITDTIFEAGVPNWSPDGKFLVYHKVLEDGSLKLFTRSLKTNTEKQITAGSSIDYSPSWSSKNSIVFNSRKDADYLNHHISILFLASNRLVTVTDTQFDYSAPCISIDGRKIVCIRSMAMTKPFRETPPGDLKKIRASSEIFLMNADGTGKMNISNDTLINRSPCFSKSGKSVYYLSQHDTVSIIKKYNLSSRSVEIVMKPMGIVNSFCVSPDEKKIVFSSKRSSGYGIYTWDIIDKIEKRVIGD